MSEYQESKLDQILQENRKVKKNLQPIFLKKSSNQSEPTLSQKIEHEKL